MRWNYDKHEIVADGVVHVVGVVSALIGVVALVALSVQLADAWELTAVLVYAGGLLTVLTVSALYNLWPVSPVKWRLRRFDHAAIYLLIAGTYTPFIAQMKGSAEATLLLAGIWAMSAVGIALKLAFPGRFDRLSILLYLGISWSGVAAYEAVFGALPPSTTWLLAAGGILYHGEPCHAPARSRAGGRASRRAVRAGRIGVLLMNLGTPEATDYWSMRRYLKEFLSDRRVIETPRLLWWPLFNGIILTTRPGPQGARLRHDLEQRAQRGPAQDHHPRQAEKLAEHLTGLAGDKVTVDWAMRYGKPEVRERIQALLDQGCDRILLVPLYPQYSAATSATACDQAFRALMDMRWQPTVRVSPPYHDDPVYIDAIVASMKAELAKLSFEPEVILVSFHGVPKEYLLKGDPYHCHCVKTWRLMREATAGRRSASA
jgi:ferrochelatase